MQYAIYFVPHKLEREKLALLRRQLCKRFENRKAVMYPVHLTLIKSFSFSDYKAFMKALERWAKKQKPQKLKLKERLTSRNSWGGIEVEQSDALLRMQEELLALCLEHGEVEPLSFDPHFSLVYAKQLPSLSSRTSPVKKIVMDRLSLILQIEEHQPFRVAKHIPLGDDLVNLED